MIGRAQGSRSWEVPLSLWATHGAAVLRKETHLCSGPVPACWAALGTSQFLIYKMGSKAVLR